MPDGIISAVIALALLAAAAVGAAAIIRATRLPGWSIVGGAAAGLLLGPTVFGRVMPATYESLFVGGVEERQVLHEIMRRHEADRVAALAAGASAETMAQLTSDQTAERERAEAIVDAAQAEDQRPIARTALLAAALVLLLGGVLGVGSAAARAGPVAAVSIGLWSALLAGALGFLAARFWFDAPIPAAAIFGAAIGIGPWRLTAIDRAAADDAEVGGARTVQAAGRFASVIALTAAFWALWNAGTTSALDAWALLPLLAMPLGWVLPNARPRMTATLRSIAAWALLPLLAALVAVRVDLFEHPRFWPVVIALLLSGDGRWLGAYLGAMTLGGRGALRTMRLVLGAMAAGPTQLALTATALHAGVLDESLALALLLGAVLIEITAPMRRGMAERVAAAEVEVDELREGGG